MLQVELTLNLLMLTGIVAASVFIGYAARSRQLREKQRKISDLRKEIVSNHAQILELEGECYRLEGSAKDRRSEGRGDIRLSKAS